MNVNWIKWSMKIEYDEFEVGVNDSIFSCNEQQEVYMVFLDLNSRYPFETLSASKQKKWTSALAEM